MRDEDIYFKKFEDSVFIGMIVGLVVFVSSLVLLNEGMDIGSDQDLVFGLILAIVGFGIILLGLYLNSMIARNPNFEDGFTLFILVAILLAASATFTHENPVRSFLLFGTVGLITLLYFVDIFRQSQVQRWKGKVISKRMLRKKLVNLSRESVLDFEDLEERFNLDTGVLVKIVGDLVEKGRVGGTLTSEWFLSNEYEKSLRKDFLNLSKESALDFEDLEERYGVDLGFLAEIVKDLLVKGELKGVLMDGWFLSDKYGGSLRENLVNLSGGSVLVFKDLENRFRAKADFLRSFVKGLLSEGVLRGNLTTEWFLTEEYEEALSKKLEKLSGSGVLVFGDLEESFGVGVDVLRTIVKRMLVKGVLRGIFCDGGFVSIDFAKNRVQDLFSRYDEVWWKTLMDELMIDREEDLISLIFIMRVTGELLVRMDEFNKSLSLMAEAEIVEKIPPVLYCPYCDAEMQVGFTACENCKEEFQTCVVCNLPVLGDLLETPCCGAYAHRPHLKEWLKIKGVCPNCGEKLKEWEIP